MSNIFMVGSDSSRRIYVYVCVDINCSLCIYNVQYLFHESSFVWFSIKDTLKLFSKVRNTFGRIGIPFLALRCLSEISI